MLAHPVALISSQSNTSRHVIILICQCDRNLTVALQVGLPAPPRPFRERGADRILAARDSRRRYVQVALPVLQDEADVYRICKGPNQKAEARIATQIAPVFMVGNPIARLKEQY
jgi:hypothetical protein